MVRRPDVLDPVSRLFMALLPASRLSGEAHGFLRSAEQGLGLVDAFGLFAGRDAVVDDTGTRLHMHGAILHQRGAQHDARIHLAIGAEIADGPGIEAALVPLQFVNDLHRPDLRRTRDRAGGKAGCQGVKGVMTWPDIALDVGNDMHNVAVAFDEEAIGDVDAADGRDVADIVTAKIEQHEVFGEFLGIVQERCRQRIVLGLGLAPRTRAGDRSNGDLALAQTHQDLGA